MEHQHTSRAWIKLVGLLGLASGLAMPHLASAESATLCVDSKNGNPTSVIYSGTCKDKEIPLALGGPSFQYKIGDTGPGGGTIFFVDYHNEYPDFDYLEAAPVNVNGRWIDKTEWGCSGIPIPEASGEKGLAVGRGRANTDAIIAANCENNDWGAAIVADKYVSENGTDDWFLPSHGELLLMNTNLLRLAGKGDFKWGTYWSSSAWPDYHAWSIDFRESRHYTYGRSSNYFVRPVRAF